MRDIPPRFRLTPTQQRVVDAAKSGKVYRSPGLANALAVLVEPVNYLDFEAFSPALPIYPGTRPYLRIPFQWSLRDSSPDLLNTEFLACGSTDPRREFAETLLQATEEIEGSITVWSPYENSVLRELAGLFPDLADRLNAMIRRIVDLLPITRNNITHPDFRGSYSLKSVAPAVAPGFGYDDLDFADGDDAQAVFYRVVADPELSVADRIRLRHSLLAYCGRDTLGLARVHHWLVNGDTSQPTEPPKPPKPSGMLLPRLPRPAHTLLRGESPETGGFAAKPVGDHP